SGLASLVARTLEKGTTKRAATELADSFGFVGADFSATVERDYALFSASTLSSHEDRLLKDFSEILTEPAFKGSDIVRVRGQMLANAQRASDDPSLFSKLM